MRFSLRTAFVLITVASVAAAVVSAAGWDFALTMTVVGIYLAAPAVGIARLLPESVVWRFAGVTLALTNFVLLVCTILLGRWVLSQIENPNDRLLTIAPTALIAFSLVTSLAVGIIKPSASDFQTTIRSALVASNMVIAFLAWELWNRWDLIAEDATEYRSMLEGPGVFAISIVLLSVCLSIVVGRMRRPAIQNHPQP